ncbi:MAG: class I SAM-dependent methyltransferase [Deltaproteobacteria bacterium]|nr:MAG: class I SAM-dependent methyltransferase [Deltaproteobacteria bacterium]
MSELYTSGAYADANPDWHDGGAPHKAEALARMLLAHAVHPAKVVDVGCGAGLVLRCLHDILRPMGWATTRWEGWDIAPEAIRRASARAAERLGFFEGDWLNTSDTADLVLCIDVFEHLHEPEAFLKELCTKTTGHALFRVPLDASLLNQLRPGHLDALERQYGHLHHYHRHAALALLEEAGFRVIDTAYHRVPPQITRRRGRLSDGLRKRLFARWPDRTVRVLGGYSLVVLCEPAHTSKA